MKNLNKQSGYSLFEVSLGVAVAAVLAGAGWTTFSKATDKSDGFTNQLAMVEQAESAAAGDPCFERIEGVVIPCSTGR